MTAQTEHESRLAAILVDALDLEDVEPSEDRTGKPRMLIPLKVWA